jgi:hypothetical protein
MDINVALGILGLFIGAAGLAFAVYAFRKGKREQEFAYEVLDGVPIASVVPSDQHNELSVLFEKSGEHPRKLQRAIVHFIRFSNFGQVPIRRSDIPAEDPLRITLKGAEILDIALISSTREVCGIRIGALTARENMNSIPIEFEFLDKGDGGLVQVMVEKEGLEIGVSGTIIGMPKGPKAAQTSEGRSEVSGWGCVPVAAIGVAGLIAAPLIYRQVTGSWDFVELLLLPIAALAIPLVLVFVLLALSGARVPYRFSDSLAPPIWYGQLSYVHEKFPMTRRKSRDLADDSQR